MYTRPVVAVLAVGGMMEHCCATLTEVRALSPVTMTVRIAAAVSCLITACDVGFVLFSRMSMPRNRRPSFSIIDCVTAASRSTTAASSGLVELAHAMMRWPRLAFVRSVQTGKGGKKQRRGCPSMHGCEAALQSRRGLTCCHRVSSTEAVSPIDTKPKHPKRRCLDLLGRTLDVVEAVAGGPALGNHPHALQLCGKLKPLENPDFTEAV